MECPTTFESVLLAELVVGLPPLTFYNLIGERDDWCFILKLHAIMECALTRLLEKRIEDQDFDDPMTFHRKLLLLPAVLPVPVRNSSGCETEWWLKPNQRLSIE